MWQILKAEFQYNKWPVGVLFGLVLVYFVGALANMLNEAIVFSGGKGKLVFSFLAAFERSDFKRDGAALYPARSWLFRNAEV